MIQTSFSKSSRGVILLSVALFMIGCSGVDGLTSNPCVGDPTDQEGCVPKISYHTMSEDGVSVESVLNRFVVLTHPFLEREAYELEFLVVDALEGAPLQDAEVLVEVVPLNQSPILFSATSQGFGLFRVDDIEGLAADWSIIRFHISYGPVKDSVEWVVQR